MLSLFGVLWLRCKMFLLAHSMCGCHCRPCTTEAGHVSNLFVYHCLYRFDYCLICRTLNLIICCSFYCRAGNPINICRFVKCKCSNLVTFEFWTVMKCTLCEFIASCFCSDEEVIVIQSSLEVVEIPPPSPEVVEVSPPPHRKGPKVKWGQCHLARE